MARRRREVAPGTEETPHSGQESGSGPQATLTVRGSADDIKRQLAGDSEKQPEAKLDPTNGHEDEKKKFVESLRNSKYLIRVKRMTPREFNGQKTNVEVWQENLPLGYQEIQEQVSKDHGGGKYRIAVVDPSSNNTITADTFEVDGDPLVPEADATQEEMDRILMRGAPKSAADISEEGLERRARVSARMIEVEALEGQLEEARARRTSGSKPATQDNTRVDDLERRLTEAKHQAELEARDRKHSEEMRELKAMIAQNAQAKPAGADPMMILLEQMREDRKQAQTQFTAILTQMKDDKLNAVLDEVKSLRNKPATQGGSLLEQAEAMLKMKKIFGWGAGDDDEDEENDENDDRPWWEKALDKLGGKLGDKLFQKFTDMEEKGEKVDREKFLKEMTDHAVQVAEEASRAKQQQNRLPPPPPLPNPATTAPGAAPVVVIPPAPVAALPPPPPPGQAPPAVVAPSAEAAPIKLTIEQEIVIRVGGVLEMVEREMELQPNEYHWSYEGCWSSLPRGILEKVCAAPDPSTMLDAFAIPHISQDKLNEMKARILADQGILAWLKIGHDELKLWWGEKLKDPRFDPYADEGSEVEEG